MLKLCFVMQITRPICEGWWWWWWWWWWRQVNYFL